MTWDIITFIMFILMSVVIMGMATQQTQKHLYNICAMFDQRLRRWANNVQMVCKCFVFAGKKGAVHYSGQTKPPLLSAYTP